MTGVAAPGPARHAHVLVVAVLTQVISISYTGHVIADTNRVNLEELAFKGSTHFLSSNQDLEMLN